MSSVFDRPSATALFATLLLACGAAACGAQTFVPVTVPDIQAHVAFSTGAAWVDFDSDGDLDLFVVTAFSSNRDNILYRNEGGDVFVKVAGSPLGQDFAQTVCSSWADYDNDGVLDAYVSGLDMDHGLLYQGVSGAAPILNTSTILSGAGVKGAGCAWGDYDNDGHVDLVVSVLSGTLGMSGGSRLFHNLGDGTFFEVTGVPPTSVIAFQHHPTWADFDGDGDLDLCFAAGRVGSLGVDYFYRNELVETGSASFTPLSTGTLATDPRDSQTLSWVDYDNDGDLDCYAINYTTVPNQLYRNDGGTFTKILTGAIVTDMGASHGVAWGDYDNDGDLDVYVVRDLMQADRYYRNEGDSTFTSIITGPLVSQTLSNYGVAAGDYDGDGDLDLFAPTARAEGPSVLYRNDLATGAHWLEVTCTGSAANRAAIGAKVRLLATIGGAPRWQMREISASSGYGSESALAAHFGLADATTVDTVIVEWPGGGSDHLCGFHPDTAITFPQGLNSVAVGDAPLSSPDMELRTVPQPFTSRCEVGFSLAHPGHVRVSVHDLQGREVARLVDGWFEGGRSLVALDGSRLPAAGLYLVRIATVRGSQTRRIVYLR